MFIWTRVKKEEFRSDEVDAVTVGDVDCNSLQDQQALSQFSALGKRAISKLNLTEVKKRLNLQAFTTNSITTFKLVLSFYQIMTQVVSL